MLEAHSIDSVGQEEEVAVPPDVGRVEEVSSTGQEKVVFEIADRHFLTETVDRGVQVQADSMERGAQTKESGAITHGFSIQDIKDDPAAIKYYTSFVALCNLRLNIVPNHC